MLESKKIKNIAIVFLIIESLLIFAPLIILGATINWPASLDEPASVILPLILEQYVPMMIGYSVYLLYSLLFFVVTYLTGRVIVGNDLEKPLFKIANGFALLSTFARSLGIVRWLFAMPILGTLYINATAELQQSIGVIYDMMNVYIGGVGELLGVSLFAVIWLVLICILIIRSKEWPNWLGYFGFVAAGFLFLNLIEIVGIDMGAMISISSMVFHFWMLSTAIVFLRKKIDK